MSDTHQASLANRVTELEEVIAGLKQEIKGNKRSATTSNSEEAKMEEGMLDELTAVDLVFKNDTKGIRRIFKKTMERHPLYEGERPERSNMQPMLMFNMHLGNKAGWERALYDRASHVMSGNLSWKKENQKLLYLPGCTVFIDDQRAIVYAPKTQNNEQHGFSLRSPLERFYGEDCELFYDNGLSSEGNVFYAGTYRCHLLNDTHPSRFMQAGAASRNRKTPWSLTYSVANVQERWFSQRLSTKDFAQLISAGDVVFEFVGLQCVGFNMELYRALTGDANGGIGAKREDDGNRPQTGKSIRKRPRGDAVSSDSGDELPRGKKGNSSKRAR